jgi:hypothetical protein
MNITLDASFGDNQIKKNEKEMQRYWMVFTPTEDLKGELDKIIVGTDCTLIVILDLPHRFRADAICDESTWQKLKSLPQFQKGGIATIWGFS